MVGQALISLSRLVIGILHAVAYGYLFLWSFEIVRELPLEKYFKKVGLPHVLVPSLIMVGLAVAPVHFLLNRLASFFSVFSGTWLFSLADFAGGLILIWFVRRALREFSGSGD